MELKTNMLVYSKKRQFDGIGCIAKILTKKVRVNHGLESVVDCKPDDLIVIDTSKCRTKSMHDFRSRIMMPKRLKNFNECIVGNEVLHFVGIGWIKRGVVTEEDLKRIPRIID